MVIEVAVIGFLALEITVIIMVVSVYLGAILGPLGVLTAARRTGQSTIIQGLAMLCLALIWTVLGLAFVQEFLHLSLFDPVLERFAFLGVVALSIDAVLGYMIATRSWPRVEDEAHSESRSRRDFASNLHG